MMNYSNMIEEKNLKKTFIIATLCSTLVGTFSSSIGLWDRVKERRKQKNRDVKQDDEIKKLKDQLVEATKGIENNREAHQQRDHDNVAASLEKSGAMIRREFDDGYDRFGRRFAIGDTITENKLQAQVIALQQTVISVLQDALLTGRPLTHADMAQLVAASNSARDGSLDALRQQRERQMLALEAPPRKALPAPRASSLASSDRSHVAPKRASTIAETLPLFCRYSLDIQYIKKKPLAASFAPGGECRCPDCGLRLDVESDDFWEINKRVPTIVQDGRGYEKEVIEERSFHLGQRFVVKCHTADGEYACVLCSKHRDADAVCPTIETLVNHVAKFHTMDELENEPDLFLEPPQPQMLALPAPPVPSPPLSVRPDRDDRASRISDLDALDRRIPMPSKYR
ncbi:zinc finger protein DZIP1 [Microdochium nivale]|nr:zinc finger protein DZIP1 [Microdochium nivale]